MSVLMEEKDCSGPGDCAWCHPGRCFGCAGNPPHFP